MEAGDFERLLATVDMATWRGHRPWEKPQLLAPGVDDEGERLQALRNLSALQGYVRDWLAALDSEELSTGELTAATGQVAARIDEALDVLCEIASGLPTDRSVLPCGRAATPADLARARARGDVQAADALFGQRLADSRTRHTASMRWEVTALPDRGLIARSTDGVVVRARSVLPSAFESQLADWTLPPAWPEPHYPHGRPGELPEQLDLTQNEIEQMPSAWHREDIDEDGYDTGGHAQEVIAAIEAIRARLTPGDVDAFVADRIAHLNATAAQLPDLLPDPDGIGAAHTYAGAHTWVDPRTIVRTPDHTAWGTINRDGERAGYVWIPTAIRQWLTTHDVPALLREAMLGSSEVQLHRMPGPAGPVHTMSIDGTHRTHLWRILDLPALFAYVDGTVLPTRMTPAQVCGNEADSTTLDQVAAIWHGLHAKEILRGTLTYPGSRYCVLQPLAVPALWLLYPPPLAAAYGRRYAELYPGAWETVGIPSAAFRTAQTWLGWATGNSVVTPFGESTPRHAK